MDLILLQKIKSLRDSDKTIKLSQEEIEGAVELLSIEDVKLRFFIGNLIIHQGARSLPYLLKGIHSEITEVRRSSVYLLGKLVKKEEAPSLEILDTLHCALLDEDPKVRKNSAIVLGELRIKQSVAALRNALQREKIEWVRPSLILALGAIGGQEVAEFLSSYKKEYESEKEALRKALDRTLELRSNLQFVRNLKESIPVELWTFEGLESVLEQDVEEKLGLKSKKIRNGILYTQSKDIYSFFSLRTFSELLISVATINISDIEEIKAKTLELLCSDNTIDRILSFHQDTANLRYRLELRGKQIKHYIRRRIVKEIIQELDTRSPMFTNSPSKYDIEIRLVIEKDSLRILWKPFTVSDTRFSYRIQDVPASIDPVVAAGIIKFLKPKLHSHHRVLDPFCGSGTILIERAIAEKCKELVGIDISQRAIESAKQNVRASGLQNIKLIKDDMRNISYSEKFDEIITNMPFGIRAGNHKTNIVLYRYFFNLIPYILGKNGTVVIYTQEVALTTKLFDTSNLKLSDVHRLEVGGLRPAIFIARND